MDIPYKIFLTSFIFFALSFGFIRITESIDLSTITKIVALSVLFFSGAGMVASTLMKIWL